MFRLFLSDFSRRLLHQKYLHRLMTFSRVMATGGTPNQPETSKYRNRLGLEKSPYLLQHANNAVDWYPWGTEAFEKAQKENKPIFLSVGYSTCHWCHVMERESFENDDIGKFLNEHFVPVKVDREERPDVDKVYMAFVQATSGGGGWPMSVWLTPELIPIVGGTYFPPDDRYYGRPGFMTMLKAIDHKWREDPGNIVMKGGSLMQAMKSQLCFTTAPDRKLPPQEIVHKCYRMLERGYDEDKGGFSKAPKFPQPVNLSFLLRVYADDPSSEVGKKALGMCTHTLKMMSKGGMYDHLAEGFHRYSTDNDWHVPHFEKMLYDQAQLVVSYAEAYQITKDEHFGDVTRRILDYVSRDLCNEAGGFYSAEDADSYPTHDALSKKEGAFCVWTRDQIQSLLNTPLENNADIIHADVFSFHYDIHPQGNVDPYKDPHDELKGQNVLIIRGDLQNTASKFGLNEDVTEKILQTSKNKLYEIRKGRPPPHLDNKMITAWNGLMISGFAKAGSVLGDADYTVRGQKAAAFVREHLYRSETGTLLRSCYCDQNGTPAQISSPIDGFVDDYAFLIRGLLDLYEASLDSSLVQWAEQLQSKMDELFWDVGNGGYFNSSTEDKSIVLRLKEDQDGAEPNANSVAASNLLRLSAILDVPKLKEQAAKIFVAFADRLETVPLALPEMVSAFMRHQRAPLQIIIVGDKTQADTQALVSIVSSHFRANNILIHTDVTLTDDFLRHRLPILSTLEKQDGLATAYVCENFTCSLPVNSTEQLEELLRRKK